jgi:hypothetical protein
VQPVVADPSWITRITKVEEGIVLAQDQLQAILSRKRRRIGRFQAAGWVVVIAIQADGVREKARRHTKKLKAVRPRLRSRILLKKITEVQPQARRGN